MPEKSAGWNRGLTKNTDKRVANNSAATAVGMKKFFESLRGDTRTKFFANKRPKNTTNMGGLRRGAGRGKNGWYHGYWCDSSWELAWVIFHLDTGTPFERNRKGFIYEFNGRKYKFFPDFILSDRYVEIKGWMDEKNKAKIAQFKGTLTVLGKKEIAPFLAYTTTKYGKDFIKLYEKVGGDARS